MSAALAEATRAVQFEMPGKALQACKPCKKVKSASYWSAPVQKVKSASYWSAPVQFHYDMHYSLYAYGMVTEIAVTISA